MIEAKDIKYGVMKSTDEIHFTGGLRGQRTSLGWYIGPIVRDGRMHQFGPVSEANIQAVAHDLGVVLLGVNQIILDDPHLMSLIWHPKSVAQSGKLPPTDRWGSVSHHASFAKDFSYSDLARNIAISLRAADIRLRDASDGYYLQLFSGLARKAEINKRFKNISLADLQLAFHSLAAELCAARDYLSSIVAKHVDAPSKIDSLARLMAWAEKPGNESLLTHPMLVKLHEGWSESSGDRWLFELGEYRNTFLHRKPMGADGMGGGIMIFATETSQGLIHKLRMDMPSQKVAGEKVEALDRFVHLYVRMQILAEHIADGAKYSSEPINFVAG